MFDNWVQFGDIMPPTGPEHSGWVYIAFWFVIFVLAFGFVVWLRM